MRDWSPPKKTCGAREPDSDLIRCDEDKGHYPRTPHQAELNGHEYTWGGDVREAIPAKQRKNSTITDETERHAAQEIFTDGVRAERLRAQIDDRGYASCEKCGRMLSAVPTDPDAPTDYSAALDQAIRNSHKHHNERRKGHGFFPRKYGNDFGHDDPACIEILCEACHVGADSEVHPGPQLRKTEATA